MKKILLFLFLLPLFALAQNPTNFPYGLKNTVAPADSTPAYFVTSQTDGVHKKTPAALIALKSDIPYNYAKIVYVNATSPNTATIFDVNNPPVTNNNLLKNDINNLYIGTDASTWVYNGSAYVTKNVPASSNFYINNTTIDAGNSKDNYITRPGSVKTEGYFSSGIGYYVNRNGSNAAQIGGYFNFSNAIGSNSMMFQLNASNGLDLWNYASSSWNKRFTFAGDGGLFLYKKPILSTGDYDILTRNTAGEVESLPSSTFAPQDGTILYHYVKWFVPTGSVSSSGTTVTSVGTQFTASMVGAKLTISGEQRIITAYTSSTVVTVASAYSINYSGVVAGSWGVYSRSYVTSSGTESNILYNTTGNISMYIESGVPNAPAFSSAAGLFQLNNNGMDFGSNVPGLRWSSTSVHSGVKDLGLRRDSAGVLEIYNGITADGAVGNRRDFLARNIIGTKYTGGADLTGTPTAPTATVGTSTTQLATTAFVQAASILNIAQTITNGVTTSAPSQDAVFNALTLKAALTGALFIGQVEAPNFKTGGNIYFGNTGAGLATSSTNFVQNNPATPGWTSSGSITAKSFIATDGAIRLKNYTVTTLPTGTQGDTAYVTDAITPTYLGALTGGGSVKCPVFFNGTVWVSH